MIIRAAVLVQAVLDVVVPNACSNIKGDKRKHEKRVPINIVCVHTGTLSIINFTRGFMKRTQVHFPLLT